MKTNLYEDFEGVSKIRSRKEKIAALRAIQKTNPYAVMFLHYVFNPNIKWLITKGYPKTFKECDDSQNSMFHRLKGEIRKLNRFLNIGPYPTLDQKKRDELYLTLLETIHPQDAKMMIYIVENRELPFSNIKIDIIQEAFPKENFGNA